MAQYLRNAEVVNAVLWEKVGDHDEVISSSLSASDGKKICARCGLPLSGHGTSKGAIFRTTVCPGRWIVTREDGRIEYLDDATFKARYIEVK